jgi:hypothetical protein
MRTILDLPDDVLRRAKIAIVERGSSLLVTDALCRDIEETSPNARCRMITSPITHAVDAPLRGLSPDMVKRLDAEFTEADAIGAHAARR